MENKNHIGKIKDLKVPGETLEDSVTGSNTSAPTPSRGFEPHIGGYENPTRAKMVAGAGRQGFGREGRGPEAANGMDRGPFSARTNHSRGNEKR